MSDTKAVLVLGQSQEPERTAPCGCPLSKHILPCVGCRTYSLTQQVLRLSGLKFFPAEFLAQNELIVALGELGESTTHADAFVTNWLKTNTECPVPAHIYAMKPRRKDNPDGSNPYGEWTPEWLKGRRPC